MWRMTWQVLSGRPYHACASQGASTRVTGTTTGRINRHLGTGRLCSSRQPTRFEPSSLGLHGTL